MLTVALGFSAVENALFLLGPLGSGDALHGILAGNLRFIGATLLHTLTSATIGIAFALAFYRSAYVRTLYVTGGFFLAVLLHTLFNFFIMEKGSGAFGVFMCVWVGVIILLLFFERLKRPARDYC
jgi:RsiW-degrading membrane proteinase PrsW (M82 family)